MDFNEIVKLFSIFSGEAESTEVAPFISIAVYELRNMLLPDVNMSDERLPFLCAAMANYRFQQAEAVKDRSEYTYAGKMADHGKNDIVKAAESMVRDYYRLCSDLIKRTDFVFSGFSAGEELE